MNGTLDRIFFPLNIDDNGRYFPDVDCTDIFSWLQDCGEHGKLSMENRQRLQATLQELKQAETFREYEIPTVCKLKIDIK